MCPHIKSLNLSLLDFESPWKILVFEVSKVWGPWAGHLVDKLSCLKYLKAVCMSLPAEVIQKHKNSMLVQDLPSSQAHIYKSTSKSPDITVKVTSCQNSLKCNLFVVLSSHDLVWQMAKLSECVFKSKHNYVSALKGQGWEERGAVLIYPSILRRHLQTKTINKTEQVAEWTCESEWENKSGRPVPLDPVLGVYERWVDNPRTLTPLWDPLQSRPSVAHSAVNHATKLSVSGLGTLSFFPETSLSPHFFSCVSLSHSLIPFIGSCLLNPVHFLLFCFHTSSPFLFF